MNSRPAPGSPFPPTGHLITAIRDVCCYGHLADSWEQTAIMFKPSPKLGVWIVVLL